MKPLLLPLLAAMVAGCANPPIMRRSTCDFELKLKDDTCAVEKTTNALSLTFCKIARDGCRQEADDCESALFQKVKEAQ